MARRTVSEWTKGDLDPSRVPAVGSTALLTPGVRTADRAAIPLPAIAVRTNPEHRLASLTAANPLSENHFFLNRHPPTHGGL